MVDVTQEMDPDPTQAYFWPAVNKRLTWLWPRYFPTRPEAIFFWPEGKKIEKFDILRGNFWNSNPNHKSLTQPAFEQGTFWPEEIFFDPKGKKLKNLTFLGEIFQIQT